MPHFQVYSFTSKSLGDLELNFAALYLQLPSSNFPSLGFSLPRAMSTDIRRPHRLRTPPGRAEPGRTRRSGVQGAGVGRPHAQPKPPLATKHPRGGNPLPFPLTARQESGKRKPLRSGPAHRRGRVGRDEEVAGGLPAAPARAKAGGRGDAQRWFRVPGR